MPESYTIRDLHRFWGKLGRKGPDDCWPFLNAYSDRNGYKKFWLCGQDFAAHRVAYYFHTRQDPGTLIVLHSCNNPPCCNHAHLRVGTHADNYDDMCRAGRHNFGESNGPAVLNDEDIPVIRARREAGEKLASIARSFGVSPGTVHNIHSRHTWRHIP